MKAITFFLVAAPGVLLTCCVGPGTDENSTDLTSVLEATRSKMLTVPTHRYFVDMYWDNRFASSTNRDTAAITYGKLADSELGFGLYVVKKNKEILYDGEDRLDIDHVKRKVVRTTAADIGRPTDYLDNLTFFHNDPKDLPAAEELTRISDTVINGKREYLYAVTGFNPTTYDAGKQVNTTRQYFVDPEGKVVTRIRKSTHIENDTVQIIDYFFSDFTFTEEVFDFNMVDVPPPTDYRELTDAENDKERLAGLVKAGDQLFRSDYTDVNNEEQFLYGKAHGKTVVMFSFIGCGGCEYALREMKKKNFALKDGIDLVYSSPVDASSTLPAYLKKKGFPFVGFGKESLMNENFKVASFPTFVVINEQGRVERVIGGYDEEAEDVLF